MNHPSFSQESAICTKKDLGWAYSILPSVTTHSSFTKCVVMSVDELFLLILIVKG